MATEAEMSLLPNYLKGATPDLLRVSMLENNLRLKAFIQYQDIRELKDGSWICWYYEKSIDFENVMSILNVKRAAKDGNAK